MNKSFFKSVLFVLLHLMLAMLGIVLLMIPVVFISSLVSNFSFLMLLNLFLNDKRVVYKIIQP